MRMKISVILIKNFLATLIVMFVLQLSYFLREIHSNALSLKEVLLGDNKNL